jgi:predicted DNA-binding transcriptional regulator YafY
VASATETAQGSVAVDAGLLGLVGAAAQRHERLAFTYRARDGSSSTRRADPYRQVLVRRRWYLLAWDVDRADWRTFRLDRVTDASRTGESYAPRELPAATAAEYVDERLKAARHRAVITFMAPVERVADLIIDRDATLEPLGEGRCRYTAWVDSFEWLAMTTTILGVDFVVDEPAGFVEYCRTLRDRLDRAVGRSVRGLDHGRW